MKKFSMLMLLAGATYALTGCMVTDYPCITDTENPNYAACATNAGAALHATNGWAHILESSQSASDQNMDGIYTEMVPFVSQDSSGNQILASVAQFDTVAPPAFRFHDDTYKQGGQKDLIVWAYAAQGVPASGTYPPAQNGLQFPGVVGPITGNCATDEGVGGSTPPPNLLGTAFDYVVTTNCVVADGDLSMLVGINAAGAPAGSPDRPPTGEAGRALANSGPLTMMDKVAMLKNGTATATGVAFTLKPGDLTITVNQGSVTKTLNMSHLNGRTINVPLNHKGMIGNQWAKDNGITGTDIKATQQQLVGFNKGVGANVTVTLFGVTKTFTNIAIAKGFDAQVLAATLDGGTGTGGNGTGSRRR